MDACRSEEGFLHLKATDITLIDNIEYLRLVIMKTHTIKEDSTFVQISFLEFSHGWARSNFIKEQKEGKERIDQ